VLGINSMRRQAAEGLAFAIAADHASQLLQGHTLVSPDTPLSALAHATSRQSDGDRQRAAGERELTNTLQQIARAADQIDSYWTRYAASCVASAAAGGDRAWFAVLEADGVRLTGTSSYDCGSWLATVRQNASSVRTRMAEATEAARRSGVYPGIIRDQHRRFRLEWQDR
jgi:hypothetical protein